MAWRQQQGRDRFFRMAKQDNYRARSAYKLIELNSRFRLIRPGDAVLDLGAAPGSWSQVAASIVGPRGRVVAVDLSEIEPLDGVKTVRADILDPAAWVEMRALLGRAADVVISDVSPQISGNRLADHARSIELADASLDVALDLAKPGGRFAVKVFRGEDFDGFLARVRGRFRGVKVAIPEATRQESREAYVVGLSRL